LSFRSNRPVYAIILLSLSILWLCAIFLPLFSSVLFPNRDLQEVVNALEQRGAAPPEAAAIVEKTIETAGPLIRAIPVAYYSGVTATVRIGGSQTSKTRQASYIAWFQKQPKPLLPLITDYEGDGPRRAYRIEEGEAASIVRGYAIPILVFGVCLFLARKKRSPLPPGSVVESL